VQFELELIVDLSVLAPIRGSDDQFDIPDNGTPSNRTGPVPSSHSLLELYFSDTIRSEVYLLRERNCNIEHRIQSAATVKQSIFRLGRDLTCTFFGPAFAARLQAVKLWGAGQLQYRRQMVLDSTAMSVLQEALCTFPLVHSQPRPSPFAAARFQFCVEARFAISRYRLL